MKRISIILFIVLMACSSEDNQNRKHIEDLKEAISKFNQGFEKGNLEVLDQMTTEDYVHTNGNSPSFGKESWFKYLETRKTQLDSGILRIERYELLDQKIVLQNKSAIVTGKILTVGIQNNLPFSSQIRVSNFWVLEGGVWKRAGFHDTKIE